jgi:carbohydrate-selective porin OprB
MPNPNTDFSAGATLLASQQNRLPRGVMAYAQSTANYTLTTSDVIATGMSVTWSAVADRYYRITYYEPLANTPSAVSGLTNLSIKDTNAAGVTLQYGTVRTSSATPVSANVGVVLVATWATSATRTLVGTGSVNVTTGTPLLQRAATYPAYMLVEDIGPI